MEFNFSKENLTPSEKAVQRLFEILPGFLSWFILLGMTALSFTFPVGAAVLIIAFTFFWLLRLIYMTFFLILAYIKLMIEKDTDWMARIKDIDRLDDTLAEWEENRSASNWRDYLSLLHHHKNLLSLRKNQDLPVPSEEIYHLTILPVVKEKREILEPAIASLSHQLFPTKRMIVILALEERAAEAVKEDVLALEKTHKDSFFHIQTIIHPKNIEGEARVKGANVTYAAKKAKEFLNEKNIPLENVILSCFDSDTVVGKEYFACLTYHFLATPNRMRSSFQPIPVYHNNIWEVPGFARVIEAGSSFFQLTEATNPEKLVTFSSHSMSFKALVDVGYWPVDMISDDSAIFWKSYIHFDGKYRVVPMYVTVSMDIAATRTFWKTAGSVYKQKRRWAWGVENFPLVMRAFLKAEHISLYNKFRHAFKLLEGHVAWSTWGFFLGFICWLPIIFAKHEFTNTVIFYNAPQITRTIFQLSFLALLISIILSISLLPKHVDHGGLRQKWGHALAWLTIPFILIFFSSLPALDAQTRLMLGRYMEFWVTDKTRHKK